MRLTLVIASLTCGGAERVLTTMANFWAAKSWQITIITLDNGKTPPFYELDPGIKHIALNLSQSSPTVVAGIKHNVERIHVLRKAIIRSRPEAVISFMDKTNVQVLLATRYLNVPVIVSERTDPARYSIGARWHTLRRLTYSSADLLIVQNNEVLDYFFPRLRSRVRIIPNPVLPAASNPQASNGRFSKPLITSMGRLSPEKGFDLLLHAFARLKNRHAEWSLAIVGEGPLRSELESLRLKLGLEDCVYLPGHIKNVHDLLTHSDLFVMASHFEGFPNALCEAMSCGLPVICTDCPSGPREIIRDGIDGILVPNEDVNSLTLAMDRLMINESERKQMARRAPEIVERFSLERIMRLWGDVLNEVVC